jgi:hypothetical protein
MQNIPGYNNCITYQGQNMRNWWDAMYDFNGFIDQGKTLYSSEQNCELATPAPSIPTVTVTTAPTCTISAGDKLVCNANQLCLQKQNSCDVTGCQTCPTGTTCGPTVGHIDASCLSTSGTATAAPTVTAAPAACQSYTSITYIPTGDCSNNTNNAAQVVCQDGGSFGLVQGCSSADQWKTKAQDFCLSHSTCAGAAPTGGTVLTLVIGFDGIGSTGDKVTPVISAAPTGAPSPFTNPSANRMTKLIFVYLDNDKSNPVSATITYDTLSGKYKGQATIPSSVTGVHTIKIFSKGRLVKTAGSQTIVAGQPLTLPSVNLTAGDLNGDNQITVVDYGIFLSCSIFGKDNKGSCGGSEEFADFNGDGTVDQLDYNLFLRDYSVQDGE